MRFNIVLRLLPQSKRLLPFNYQYELSSWIYKVLRQADATYSHFLHEQGYAHSHKHFKLFCFSNMELRPSPKAQGEGLLLQSDLLSFRIGFYAAEASENFVMGLFMHQKGSIGNVKHRIDFVVERIEARPLGQLAEQMRLKTVAPLVVARKKASGYDDYLHPEEVDFKELFLKNLLDKYQATGQELPPEWQHYAFELEILPPIKSKLISIKSDTERLSQVKGYLFGFRLKAPQALIELGLLAGFGKLNAQGFGACEVVED